MLLLLLLGFAVALPLCAQKSVSVVTLKNGTVMKGELKSIVPNESLTIVIAGVETNIAMEDVGKIEEEDVMPPVPTAINSEKLVVTDLNEYPDSFELDVCGTKIKMILVRGGMMNMGFSGKRSVDMNSEPVHLVGVTSFYISDTFIPTSLAKQLTNKKIDTSQTYFCAKWADCKKMADSIAVLTKIPVRLPTEAEWEYAACSDKQNMIFSECTNDEFCVDYFDVFNPNSYVVDPTGPLSGRRHVVRYYGKAHRKFDRDHSDPKNRLRLVVKAKDYVKR